jgi:hypothetical protein
LLDVLRRLVCVAFPIKNRHHFPRLLLLQRTWSSTTDLFCDSVCFLLPLSLRRLSATSLTNTSWFVSGKQELVVGIDGKFTAKHSRARYRRARLDLQTPIILTVLLYAGRNLTDISYSYDSSSQRHARNPGQRSRTYVSSPMGRLTVGVQLATPLTNTALR